MAKNRFLGSPPQSQPTPAMSHAHSHTTDAAPVIQADAALLDDGADEDDICPVCDGVCTCRNIPSTPIIPSLKIKLPKPKTIEPVAGPSVLPQVLDFYHPVLNPTGPKRRGRPPKALVAAREAAERAAAQGHDLNTSPGTLNYPLSTYPTPDPLKRKPTKTGGIAKARPIPRGRPPKNAVRKRATGKPTKSAVSKPKRRGPKASSSYSTDRDDSPSIADSDFEDGASSRFPTFVSVSTLSSSDDSSSSSSSSSAFDTDSSMEAEEESFIRQHSQPHMRRELLGDDDPARKQHRKSWVIRPRKQSVGLSDVEMDGDSDATEDEDDDATEAEVFDHEDATEELHPRHGYVGVATGWSEDEDEESSFDAQLFFANLSDSDKGRGTSSDFSGADEDGGDDGDQSDLDAMSVDDQENSGPLLPAFEVAEGWDGRLVFTNGPHDGHPERRLFHLEHPTPVEPSPSPSIDSALLDSATEVDEDGYEQDGELAEGDADGDTTDEELIGEDNLPNERAMRLFAFPPSISHINPLSTMSPSHSPTPRVKKSLPLAAILVSPRPADILAGRYPYEPEMEDDVDAPPISQRSAPPSQNGLPTPGHFIFDDEQKHEHAVIGPQRRHAHVPSPHARSRIGRGRGSSSASLGREDELQRFLRKTMFLRPSSVSAPDLDPLVSPPLPMMETERTSTVSSSIELDDMIDSSFLDASDHHPHVQPPPLPDVDDPHNSHLHRWDFISVGAFRQTREVPNGWMSDPAAGGWGSDTPATAEYGGMIKPNPLSAMMWQNKPSSRKPVTTLSIPGSSSDTRGNLGALVSPALSPVSDRDGERTPTTASASRPSASMPSTPLSRRELKQDKKSKKKVHHQPPHTVSPRVKSSKHHHPQHQHHHHHTHHPNSKSRAASGSQRSSGGIPALNI